MSEDDKAYYARMDEQIAAMPDDQQKALIKAIKLLLRTFVEEDTQGVLVVADNEGMLVTMGLNATFYDCFNIMHTSVDIFNQTVSNKDGGTTH